MKTPRNLSGKQLVQLLNKYGYQIVRQKGSHMHLTSKFHGSEHHICVPAHNPLRLGTLNAILNRISIYLKMKRSDLDSELFG